MGTCMFDDAAGCIAPVLLHQGSQLTNVSASQRAEDTLRMFPTDNVDRLNIISSVSHMNSERRFLTSSFLCESVRHKVRIRGCKDLPLRMSALRPTLNPHGVKNCLVCWELHEIFTLRYTKVVPMLPNSE